MTPETLEALKGSIEKWRKIVEEGAEDHGARDCPLCKLFRVGPERTPPVCDGCPVKAATGRDGCAGSPYRDYAEMESLEDAEAELEFLRSLLPKEEGE